MKMKKGMRAFCLLLVMILIGSIFVPAVSSYDYNDSYKLNSELMTQIDPKTDTEGYAAVDVINIDQSIKDATPYYNLLILDDEGKQNHIKDIELNTLISSEEKASLKKDLNTIWENYPIVSETVKGDIGYPTYGGTITKMKLSESAKNTRLSYEENKILERHQYLMNEEYKLTKTGLPGNNQTDNPENKKSSGFSGIIAIMAVALFILIIKK